MAHADRLAGQFASLFEVSRPANAQRQSWEVPALLIILVLAAVVRFWGLGSWGLENDEETMAMPTMHILQDGTPMLPSGMFYARGISQLYMMAGSAKLFGVSEWAFRLPSVLCGLGLVVLTMYYGRRFLSPVPNLALVLIAAFLPAFIADSQEARMYIFMSACLAGFGVLIFEWERSAKPAYLAAAVAVMLVGLQFHVLTVFGAFLVFYPGLIQGNVRKLIQGAIAFAAIVAGYFLISHWVQSFYPPRLPQHGIEVVLDERIGGLEWTNTEPLWLMLCAAGFLALVTFAMRRVKVGKTALIAGTLLFLGFCAQVLYFNHVGLLLLLAAILVLARQSAGSKSLYALVAFLAITIMAVEFILLHHAGVGGSRKVLGAMVGLPSIWPFLRMAQFSPAALALAAAGIAIALFKFSRGQRLAEYWLFFALGVWVPMLMLGVFSWDVAPRYTEFALLPVFIAAIAPWVGNRSLGVGALAVVVALAVVIVNPLAVAKVVNAGYTIHPDHKGAAEFIKSVHLKPNDIVLAEDVNQQTYYLGHVDYWLIGEETAELFARPVGGELRDMYTNAPVIKTGEELTGLIQRKGRGDIYVIGSGEQQEDGRRHARGSGISAVMQSSDFKVVYHGRDGLTKVWKVDAPGAEPQAPPTAR